MSGAIRITLEQPRPRSQARSSARLLGLGCATPSLKRAQSDVADQLARVWGLHGANRARWRRIIEGSGVEHRCGVVEIADVIALPTAVRMTLFEEHAPALAAEAARAAMDDAGLAPQAITDLIVVSCTGFAAPGLDARLPVMLGLDPGVRRSTLGFMGCFGAITGLRAAIGACAADPHAAVLVVCCELCSLHLRNDPSPDNMVASALFADGAAAAVVASGGTPALRAGSLTLRSEGTPGSESRGTGSRGTLELTLGHTRLMPEGDAWMSWRITDAGFAMTLRREVPAALGRAIASFVYESDIQPETFLVHPGGPGIIDAVDIGLGLAGARGLQYSREVLGARGNMSSATVLFVLREALAAPTPPPLPAMLLAFGPGLTLESLSLVRVDRQVS